MLQKHIFTVFRNFYLVRTYVQYDVDAIKEQEEELKF